MSFPIVRPVDIARMPPRGLERLRRRFAEECSAAAVRHEAILAARIAPAREPAWVTSARLTELERCAAEVRGPVCEIPVPVARAASGRFARWHVTVPDRRAS